MTRSDKGGYVKLLLLLRQTSQVSETFPLKWAVGVTPMSVDTMANETYGSSREWFMHEISCHRNFGLVSDTVIVYFSPAKS